MFPRGTYVQTFHNFPAHTSWKLSHEHTSFACPYEAFQSSFSQITGILFSEYVRRRKLTLAAYDLQNTDRTILDIGLDYGYQSPDAFRVAFKALHHVTPSEVRTNSPMLTFYCKLRFEARDKITDNVLTNLWYQINTAFLPSSRFHKGPLPTIEKYVIWNEAEDDCIVEIWIPQ